jgi:hypothetical protein
MIADAIEPIEGPEVAGRGLRRRSRRNEASTD